MSAFRFSTIRSPPRRLTVQSSEQSPFCTSPSQLQEVTFDASMSATASLGLRSPGKTSPIRGRTMKEYEEQLGQLQKENFNLKLRIYFLEERMEHMNVSDDKENILKENVDLKVRLETLRKELIQKQDLLCQAAKAVELMEEQQQVKIKQLQQEYLSQKNTLESRIDELEKELHCNEKIQKFVDMSGSAEKYLEQIEEQHHRIENLLGQNHQLECRLQDEIERANSLEVKLQQQWHLTNETNERCERLECQLKEQSLKLQDLNEELNWSEKSRTELKHKICSLEEMLNLKNDEIKTHLKELSDHEAEINKLKDQHQDMLEHEFSTDEKQRQIDGLCSSLTARDSAIKSLEAKYASSKASMRSLEFQLASAHLEVKRLKEELHSLKAQMKLNKSVDNGIGDSRPSSSNSWPNCLASKSSSHKKNRHLEGFVEISVAHLQEMENKLKIGEERENSLTEKLQKSELRMNELRQQLSVFENQIKEVSGKLKDACIKNHECDVKINKLEHNNKVACQTIQTLVRKTKELEKENIELKETVNKKQKHIQETAKKLNDVYSKAKGSPKHQHSDVAQKLEKEKVHGVIEETGQSALNEQGDTFSFELEVIAESLLNAVKEKQELVEEIEAKLMAAECDKNEKEQHIIELQEEIRELHNCLNAIQVSQTRETNVNHHQKCEMNLNSDITNLVNVVESKTHNMLLEEVQEKNREIERLNAELRRRTTNLQELVNKELWDKNREIEKLQDRLNTMCERKELQIRSISQQLTTKDLQLKTLKNKIIECVTQSSVPATLIFEKLHTLALNQNITLQNDGSVHNENVRDISVPLHMMSSCVGDAGSSLHGHLLATIEDNKYLSQKVDELQERIRNTPERDSESRVVQTLRAECSRLKEDAEAADRKYREAREGINILTCRLEELAHFLRSLLENKELLCGISLQRHRFLKQALESSIELSRRLSMSFSLCQTGNETGNSLQLGSFSDIFHTNHNFSFSELLKEDGSHEETRNTDVRNSGLSQSGGPLVEKQDDKDLANQKPKYDLHNEATSTSDLITFVSPPERFPPPERNSSLSSMTFYNKEHIKSASDVCTKGHEDSINLPQNNNQRDIMEGNLRISEKNPHTLRTSKSSPLLTVSRSSNTNTACSKDILNQKSNSPPKIVTVVQNISDSEAWSEPDRNVSLERIGLQEEAGRIVLAKTRNPRIQESDNSSESSEETAREETRTPVIKRTRGEVEIKRLQNKVHGLEQLNDALKTELDILRQFSCHLSTVTNFSVCSTEAQEIQESTINRSAQSEFCINADTPVTISVNLLHQIQQQREKLEASLSHNDLIRKQLETVIYTLSERDNTQKPWQKFREITEELNASQIKICELEGELKEARNKLKDMEQEIKTMEVMKKELQATTNAASDLKIEVNNLQIVLQEKDNEILERKCLHLELENKSDEQNIEREKKMHYFKVLRDEAEIKIAKLIERNGYYEKHLCELEEKVKTLEIKLLEAELMKEELKKENVEQKAILEAKICEVKNINSELEKKISDLKKELQNYESTISDLMHNVQSAERNVLVKEKDLKDMETKCKEMGRSYSLKINELERKLEEREWVYKTELEKKASEIERVKKIEEGLQKRLKDFESKECMLKADGELKLKQYMESCKVNESFLKEKLQACEQALKAKESELRRQMDESAVATSELALEKSKLVNDKVHLEQEMQRLEHRLAELEKCKSEVEQNLQLTNKELEMKVLKLEEEKNNLKKSVQGLESANAELEKTLAKINERHQHMSFTRGCGTFSGGSSQEQQVAHQVELLSPISLSPGLDIFSGASGSLPSSLCSLSAKFFDSIRDPTDNSLQQQSLTRQCSDFSDYVSEELSSEEYKGMICKTKRQLSAPSDQQTDNTVDATTEPPELRNSTSSPDLGIESDQGRFSSLEATSVPSNHVIQLETTQYLEDREGKLETVSAIVLNSRTGCDDYTKLQEENAELKRRLIQTRRALEKTVEQLVSANQRKKQVEKAICKQLHKTNSILKQSRVNLQTDSLAVTGGSDREREC